MDQKKSFLRKENIILNLIYIILVFAVMSDILRIPGTSLTFYRLSMPIAFFIVMLYPKWAKRLVMLSIAFCVVNFIFNLFCYQIYSVDITFSAGGVLKYCVLYFSIFLAIILVCILKEILKEDFELSFINWICAMGVILMVTLIAYDIAPYFFGELPLDNPNNYGCYIAAVFPFYLGRAYQNKRLFYFLLSLMCLILLYVNDSKVSLFGVLIQIAIFFCITGSETKKSFVFRRLIVPALAIVVVIAVIFGVNPAIHGYPLQGIISEPIERILTNNPYPTYTASTSFRTNTTIFGFNTLWDLKGMGIGAGNFGIILKKEFPNINPAYTQALNAPSMSLHNSWLEFVLDFGIIAVILLMIPLIYAIRLYFGKQKMSLIEKISLIFIFSFPVWVLGPSGVYTQYYLFVVITYLVICRKVDRTEEGDRSIIRKGRLYYNEDSIYF